MSKVDLLKDKPVTLARANSIRIIYSTEWTRGQAKRDALEAKDTLGDRDKREREEAQKVVLEQPHRRGNPSVKAGDPLAEFCDSHWPNDMRFANKMYAAGRMYDQIIGDSRLARGLPRLGQTAGNGAERGLTEEQIQAERELAVRKRDEADGILINIDLRAKNVMEDICYWQREPGPYDESRLVQGLYRLADWLGMIEHGINEGKR